MTGRSAAAVARNVGYENILGLRKKVCARLCACLWYGTTVFLFLLFTHDQPPALRRAWFSRTKTTSNYFIMFNNDCVCTVAGRRVKCVNEKSWAPCGVQSNTLQDAPRSTPLPPHHPPPSTLVRHTPTCSPARREKKDCQGHVIACWPCGHAEHAGVRQSHGRGGVPHACAHETAAAIDASVLVAVDDMLKYCPHSIIGPLPPQVRAACVCVCVARATRPPQTVPA